MSSATPPSSIESSATYQPPIAMNPSAGGGYTLPTYEFVIPSELKPGYVAQRYPIVIVGAGLAGLTAACDFAARGIKAVVIDEDNTVGVKGASSRGICYAQKSLEIFKRLGLFEKIKAKGVQWSVGKTLAGNDVVYEFDLASQEALNISCQPPFINLQQFYLEWFLVDEIVEQSIADLRWKSRVVGVQQFDEFVELEIETPQGNYRVTADWVIDASGLRSPIRQASGLKVDQSVGIDRWCISDVRFKDKKPIERWTWIEAPFNDDRAVWQHLMADDVWRLDYQMAPEADLAYVSSPEVVADRLKRHLGEDVEFELVWVGPYSYRSHLLESFRFKRTFFAGDCAHVMSPFGARGGNSAIQDADNLVWKLARVMAGDADPKLLDSYCAERREGAQTNIEFTDRTSRFLSPRSKVEKMIRNAVIDLAKSLPFARAMVNTGRLSTANTYQKCPLSLAAVSRPIQNVKNLSNSGPADLVGLIVAGNYQPLLITTARGISELVALGWSSQRINAELKLTTVCLACISTGSPSSGKPSAREFDCLLLSVSSAIYDRLLSDLGIDLGVDDNNTLALVRPDCYWAGSFAPQRLLQSLAKLSLLSPSHALAGRDLDAHNLESAAS